MLIKRDGQTISAPPDLSEVLARAATAAPVSASGEGERFVRIDEVQSMVGVSRTTLYEWMRATPPRFPKPVPLGGSRVAWLLSEVRAWMAARIAERDN